MLRGPFIQFIMIKNWSCANLSIFGNAMGMLNSSSASLYWDIKNLQGSIFLALYSRQKEWLIELHGIAQNHRHYSSKHEACDNVCRVMLHHIDTRNANNDRKCPDRIAHFFGFIID